LEQAESMAEVGRPACAISPLRINGLQRRLGLEELVLPPNLGKECHELLHCAEAKAIFAEDYADFMDQQALSSARSGKGPSQRKHCADSSPLTCSESLDGSLSRVSTAYLSCAETSSSLYTSRLSDDLATPRRLQGVSTPRTPCTAFERLGGYPAALPPLESSESLAPCGSFAAVDSRHMPQQAKAAAMVPMAEEQAAQWFAPTSWLSGLSEAVESFSPRRRLHSEALPGWHSASPLQWQTSSCSAEGHRGGAKEARQSSEASALVGTSTSPLRSPRKSARKQGRTTTSMEGAAFLGDALEPASSFDLSSPYLLTSGSGAFPVAAPSPRTQPSHRGAVPKVPLLALSLEDGADFSSLRQRS